MEEKIAYVDFDNNAIYINGQQTTKTDKTVSLWSHIQSLLDLGYAIKKRDSE